eukprot:scaffold291823_cov33-Tisochrysis_lutea.AAC.1
MGRRPTRSEAAPIHSPAPICAMANVEKRMPNIDASPPRLSTKKGMTGTVSAEPSMSIATVVGFLGGETVLAWLDRALLRERGRADLDGSRRGRERCAPARLARAREAGGALTRCGEDGLGLCGLALCERERLHQRSTRVRRMAQEGGSEGTGRESAGARQGARPRGAGGAAVDGAARPERAAASGGRF